MKNLPVTTAAGAVIRLSDVADVREITKDMTSYTVIGGQQGIIMTIQKQSDAQYRGGFRRGEGGAEKDLRGKPDVSFSALMDNSDYIKNLVRTCCRPC
jgi:HAE1 family hydrophobic/amphiphilic exporter-1